MLAVKFVVSFALFMAFDKLTSYAPVASALKNGLARTPPMGWIAWERFTCTVDCFKYPNDCINSRLIKEMAKKMVEDGYAEVGYEYINLDDCWSEMERNSTSGSLVPDKTRFVSGMADLADYVHSKNLKFGLYGDCGTKTCAGYPAQLKSEEPGDENHMALDANTFAEWQVDSFKFDGCYLDAALAEQVCPAMAKALSATKRPMMLICEWPFYMMRQHDPLLRPNFTLAQEACNVWRYFDDVEDSWMSILSIVDFTIKLQPFIAKHHGPGHWFDPDQLVIGNFALSHDQARAQMALWCIWSAPLYMGNDLRNISPEMGAILKNKKLIEVDQDKLGVFGALVGRQVDGGEIQAFVKPVEPIKNGCPSFVVLYLYRNALGNTREVSFRLRDLLSKSLISLAAERYASLYAADSVPLNGPFTGHTCAQRIRFGMTKQPLPDGLIAKSAGQKEIPPPVEETDVNYRLIDLFDDEPDKTVGLNGTLSLRVNPSGVRIVKLIEL